VVRVLKVHHHQFAGSIADGEVHGPGRSTSTPNGVNRRRRFTPFGVEVEWHMAEGVDDVHAATLPDELPWGED